MAPAIYKSVSQVSFYALDTVMLKNYVTDIPLLLENMPAQRTTPMAWTFAGTSSSFPSPREVTTLALYQLITKCTPSISL
jgi:hypothetical protein